MRTPKEAANLKQRNRRRRQMAKLSQRVNRLHNKDPKPPKPTTQPAESGGTSHGIFGGNRPSRKRQDAARRQQERGETPRQRRAQDGNPDVNRGETRQHPGSWLNRRRRAS